jgi:hypothetical protein
MTKYRISHETEDFVEHMKAVHVEAAWSTLTKLNSDIKSRVDEIQDNYHPSVSEFKFLIQCLNEMARALDHIESLSLDGSYGGTDE